TGKLADPSVLPRLRAMLTDPQVELAANAAASIGRLAVATSQGAATTRDATGLLAVSGELIHALAATDEHLRANAALALGAFGLASAAGKAGGDTRPLKAALVPLLAAAEPRVRLAAARALAQLGDRTPVERMAADDRDARVRAQASVLLRAGIAPRIP